MAAPFRHFWDPHTADAMKIQGLLELGPTYQQEDVVWQVWSRLLERYFPADPGPQGQGVYTVDREPYRGPPGAVSTVRPDHVVLRLLRAVNPPPPAPQVPQIHRRDILWVECKAPNHDTPGQWNLLITEAAGRLREAHPTRNLFLITAVGLKWMFFKWDPANVNPLQVLAHNVNQAWTIPCQELCFDPTLLGQRHVVQNNATGALDTVDTRRAYTLDCVTLGQNNMPVHGQDLILAVNCFAHVQNTAFPGYNPAHFP
ncbi:hypothetical protein N658DRAFT_502184 [Parathielavia hyrcaniae]|uniref:Uncharacterized protein n=1 Tax=Parathielavia hyrcaniae TaxID=113614 RepID=A0AAN6SWG4_9PEZI|nr:hypothetical protein N658DRAFT_502184 [Parathielavia hyrcaniae]